MPTYVFRCPSCNKQFERVLRLAEYDTPQACGCGAIAERQICAPAVRGDYAPYECPITGRAIEGRRAHEENLKRHGCRVLEPGESAEASRRRAESDRALESSIEATAEQFVATLPSRKLEQLASELQSGVTATVERR
jgi:putative FmdB family regulatory protein